MSDKTVEEILAEAAAILNASPIKKKKRNTKAKLTDIVNKPVDEKGYLQPARLVLYYEFLTTNDFHREDALHHAYFEDSNLAWHNAHNLGRVVYHGHGTRFGCASPYFCHVYGYVPTGAESPTFIKLFYDTWPYARKEREEE